MNNQKQKYIYLILMLILACCLCGTAAAGSAQTTPMPLPTVSPAPMPEFAPTLDPSGFHYEPDTGNPEAAPTVSPIPPTLVTVWKVTAPDINTEALLDYTFDRTAGAGDSGIRKEDRGNGHFFWCLEENYGIPFCGVDPQRNGIAGIQTWFDIYRHNDQGEERTYYYDLDEWNTIPAKSGFGTVCAGKTCIQAMELLKNLGLYGNGYEARPVYFSTLGRMPGTTECRKVVLEETLEGLPVRWSATALTGSIIEPYYMNVPYAEKCYTEVIYSDEDGLLKAEGSWCAFEPMTWSDSILSKDEALTQFTKIGKKPANGITGIESCWFLDSNGKEATATRAYRVGNTYLSAADGTWLQTEQ